eukprot:307876_1
MTPSLLQILSHVESMYLVIMTMILSSFINQFQCQIIGIELQTSLMPINGEAWATYYQSAHHKIWLFSPRRWNPVIDMHCDPIVISYDIDNDIFEIQRNISNATPSFNGWVPRYYAAIGENIYLNGDTGAIDVYNINTDTTTNIHSIWFRQSCVATDGRFVFFMGGEETGSTMGSWATNAHDTTTGVWYQGKDQMHRLRRFPCEIMNGTIYTFGGNNIMSQDYISKLYVGTGADVIDNYQNNNWATAGNLIIARQFHNSAVCDSLDSNLVYLIGGSHWTDVEYKVLDIEIYDINTEITQLASFTLKEERTNPAVMCIDQHIYIFGGVTADKTTLYTWEKSQLLTVSPTEHPTIEPSVAPTSSPTSKTDEPTYTNNPSTSPTKSPSSYPSDMPSVSPTELSVSPSKHPSIPHINTILPTSSTKSTATTSATADTTKTSVKITLSPSTTIRTTPREGHTTILEFDDDIATNNDNQFLQYIVMIQIGSLVLILCLCGCILFVYCKCLRKKHPVAAAAHHNHNDVTMQAINVQSIQTQQNIVSVADDVTNKGNFMTMQSDEHPDGEYDDYVIEPPPPPIVPTHYDDETDDTTIEATIVNYMRTKQ